MEHRYKKTPWSQSRLFICLCQGVSVGNQAWPSDWSRVLFNHGVFGPLKSLFFTKSFCFISKLADGRIWTWLWGPLSASLLLAKLPPNKAPSHPSVDTHLQMLAHVSYFKSKTKFTGGEFHQRWDQHIVSPFCQVVLNMLMARYTVLC